MSDIENLKNENLKLKQLVKKQKEIIKDISRKPYKNIEIGHPHVGLIRWDDGTLTV